MRCFNLVVDFQVIAPSILKLILSTVCTKGEPSKETQCRNFTTIGVAVSSSDEM